MKAKRHAKILELIESYAIDTQEELQNRLQECGFKVTQATVSRDIKELRLIKTQSPDGRYHYAVNAKEGTVDMSLKFHTIFTESVIKVDCAGHMVVDVPQISHHLHRIGDQGGLRRPYGGGQMLHRLGKCRLCRPGFHPLERSGGNLGRGRHYFYPDAQQRKRRRVCRPALPAFGKVGDSVCLHSCTFATLR